MRAQKWQENRILFYQTISHKSLIASCFACKKHNGTCRTYTELDAAFCGAIGIELRDAFFSALILFGTLVVGFFDSFALLLEALLFDCLESFDLDVEECSITT